MNSTAAKIILRILPLIIVISLLGWCTSNRRSMQENLPVKTELQSLFQEKGLLDRANADLAVTAKNVGEVGMNRLLYEAAPTASLDALKWLVKHGADPKNVGRLQNDTLLQQIAKRPGVDRLEFFLKQGLDPLEKNRDGRTVLHVAAESGLDEATLRLLTGKGLKLNDADTFGRQPIHYAAVKSLQLLTQAGADVNAKDSDDMTPLHLAAQKGNNAITAELLRLSASVFEVDKKGRTPLHLAALYGSESVIDSLLAAGAQKTIRDNDGMTPRDLQRNAWRIRRQSAVQNSRL